MLLKYLKIFKKNIFLYKISCTFLALGIYICGHFFLISNFLLFLIRNKFLKYDLFFFTNVQELSKLSLFTFGISPTISSFFSINLLKLYWSIKNKFVSKLIESNIFFIFLFFSFSYAKFYNIKKNIKINSFIEIIIFLILIFGSIVAKKIANFIDYYGFGKGITLLFLIDTELNLIKNLFLWQINLGKQFKICCFFLLFFIPLYLTTQTFKIKIAKPFTENFKNKSLDYTNSEFIQLKLPIPTTYPLILTSNLFIWIQKKFNLDKKNYLIYYYSLLYWCIFLFYFFSFNIEEILNYFQQKTILIVENSVPLSSNDETKKFLIKKLLKLITFFSCLFVLIFLIKDYFISLFFSAKVVEIYFFTSISCNLMLSVLVEVVPKLKIIYLEKKLEWLSFSLNL